MNTAFIKEIFYSIQGEGLYAGTAQHFIRFCDCNLNCSYCDTNWKKSEILFASSFYLMLFSIEINKNYKRQKIIVMFKITDCFGLFRFK